MTAVVVAAFVWGLVDARRDRLGRVLVRWAVVGLLVGLALAVLPQVGSEEFFSVSTYLGDVPFSATVGFVLAFVSAALGAVVGALLGRRPAATEGRPASDGTTAA